MDSPYDRQLLLSDAKRDAVLDLSEIQSYGRDSFDNSDHVSLYGLSPAEWYAKGARILGRTAVECTPDRLAREIGRDIAATLEHVPAAEGVIVVDPFAGSGNTLHWILRNLPNARGIGFELHDAVFDLTRRNLQLLEVSVDIVNTDFPHGLSKTMARPEELVVVFVSPPWGNAVGPGLVLDLSRTSPPIAEIIDVLTHRFNKNRLLFAVQVLENVEPDSVTQVRARFDWSVTRVYDLNRRGPNPGLLIGAKRWVA